MPRPRRLFVLGAVALGLTGTACGADNSSTDLATKDPQAAMAAASERTAEAKSVRLALSATSSTGVKVLSGTGSYDFVTDRGRFTLQTALGAGADMLITATDVFLKNPQAQQAGAKPWIRLSEADLAASRAAGSAQFIDSIRRQVDPRSTLDALGANVPDLKKVGEQTLRGTKTTQLRGQVDLSDEAIAAAPAAQQEGLRSAQRVFGSDGYPVDVWLDGDGRVRRVQYDVSSGEGDAKTATTVKLDLYDFGEAPAIQLPADSDVGDASTLLNPSPNPAVGK